MILLEVSTSAFVRLPFFASFRFFLAVLALKKKESLLAQKELNAPNPDPPSLSGDSSR
jgi:hypothetical protein